MRYSVRQDENDGLYYINRYNEGCRDTVYSNIPRKALAESLAKKLNEMSPYEGNQ